MDELNNYDELFETYFEEMDIPKEEKEKRSDFAKKFNNALLLLFATITVMKGYDYIRKKYIEERLSREYRDILSRYIDVDDYYKDYINEFSENTTDTTLDNIDDEFFLSPDRAFLISVNEANTGFNYNDFVRAINQGKTRKQWITEKDRKVRRTHKELDDKVIPILEPFKVGKTLMRYPHDQLLASGNLEEIYNCRCSVKYY